MIFQMDFGIVLVSSCGKDICCCDREDSESCFEDEHSSAVIYLYRELTSAKNVSSLWCLWQNLAQDPVLLGFPTEVRLLVTSCFRIVLGLFHLICH